MGTSGYAKPLPTPDVDSKPYWEACKRHELRLQRCTECGSIRFPPIPMCGACNSLAYDWARVSGRGKIYAWTRVYRPTHGAFMGDAPYVLVMVEIEEQQGVRLPGNLIGCEGREVDIGMPVEVVFDDVTDEVALPRWRPA